MAKKVHTFRDARGRVLIERRNLPKGVGSSLANDAYHFMRSASWTWIFVLFAALFLGMNLVFAVILWAAHAQVTNVHGFLDYFWFSVQSLATIGYGVLSPDDTLSNTIVTIESFLGFGLTALVTGVFFSRFSTPSARVIFSDVAIIGSHDGERALIFRVGNARVTAIVEASLRVYLTRDETLKDGERMRRVYDLELIRNVSPIFSLSWVVHHIIDEKSPLFGVTPETLTERMANIVVTFQGIDDRLAAVVHTRFAYNATDIVFDRRFADVVKLDAETGVRYLDFGPFHDTEAIPAQSIGAAAPASV